MRVTFDELLAGLPRSTHAAWRAAAAHELRGESTDTIALHLDGLDPTEPYATPTADATTVSAFVRYGFAQLSDLTDAQQVTAALVLTELEGGASGVTLDLDRGRIDWVGFEAVRFDIITTHVVGQTDALLAFAKTLHERLELAAREEVELLLEPRDPLALATRWAEVTGLFPRARFAFAADAAALDDWLQTAERTVAASPDPQRLLARTALAWTPPADYLTTVVTQRAVQLLWANLCARHLYGDAADQPLPAPLVLARIAPADDAQTPEAYLIDATIRTTAALSAGAGAVSIAPHPGQGSAAGLVTQRRRARNVLNVLAIEARLGQEGDALRGAALLEDLAVRLARRVWEQPG